MILLKLHNNTELTWESELLIIVFEIFTLHIFIPLYRYDNVILCNPNEEYSTFQDGSEKFAFRLFNQATRQSATACGTNDQNGKSISKVLYLKNTNKKNTLCCIQSS